MGEVNEIGEGTESLPACVFFSNTVGVLKRKTQK